MIKYTKITTAHISGFKAILGDAYVFYDVDSLTHYSHDETEDLTFLPEIVLKPATPTEIAEIVKMCNGENIAITPRGGGTGSRDARVARRADQHAPAAAGELRPRNHGALHHRRRELH